MSMEETAKKVAMKFSSRGEAYRKYFEEKMKKWNVDSPADIPEDKRDDFFNEVDSGWISEDEEPEKKASVEDRVASRVKTSADYPYAVIIFGRSNVEFTISFEETSPVKGKTPYGRDPVKAIESILTLVKRYRVPSENVEIIA